MTLHEFFKGRAIVIAVLVVIFFGFLIYGKHFSDSPSYELEKKGSMVFEWKFEESKVLNPDGNPANNVFLLVTYESGRADKKLMDTTDGGCAELPDAEKGSAPDTKNIQCYYAGLGFKYKITKGDFSYLVLRKAFEEGSPEYIPPEQEYEKIAEFPIR